MDDMLKTMKIIYAGAPLNPCQHHILHRAASSIATELGSTINCSIETTTFPDDWKHAEINLLLKKLSADPADPKNFRPISLLSFPAKVIERAINT